MPNTDVIVLGGGIIGCALAEELARRGQRVVVVERGRIGTEASAAAAGILAAQSDLSAPGPFFELCQAARRLYPGWIRRVQRASGLAVEFRIHGLLWLAMTAAEERTMAHQARWQQRAGFRVQRWSPAQVWRREPVVDGRIRCGFYFPTEAQVDNVALMEALALACRRAGVTLRARTRARCVRVQRGAVRGIETDRGWLRAPMVVNCLGSWADMDGTFPIRLPVEPARGQILVFRAPRRLLHHSLMSDYGYAVQRRDGRVLVGSTVERVGFEKALTLSGIRQILGGVQRMSRAFDACPLLEAWAGFRPLTPDRLPILGPTSIDGLYVATGHFRHGILLAPITAAVMAGLILRGRSSFDLTPFHPQRFLK